MLSFSCVSLCISEKPHLLSMSWFVSKKKQFLIVRVKICFMQTISQVIALYRLKYPFLLVQLYSAKITFIFCAISFFVWEQGFTNRSKNKIE